MQQKLTHLGYKFVIKLHIGIPNASRQFLEAEKTLRKK
jgi:hypothetical protein